MKQHGSARRHFVVGSMWTIGRRWGDRLTGLVSTVVLARLLSPSDFGVVAIAAIVVGAIEVFTQNGQYGAIIRHPAPTREHYDSAWTVSLLLGFGLGLVVLASAPIASLYFHEPRATLVITVLSIRTMLMGTQNVGVVNFRRDLQFHKQFLFSFYPSLAAFVVTISSAFVLRNYWALVIGIMTQYVTTVVLSYTMEPFRPRISFEKTREIWSFSTWTLIRWIGLYLNNQVDIVAVGGFAGTAAMGQYEVGRDLATSPTSEIVYPMMTTLMPVMAKVQLDHEKRRDLYLEVLYLSAIICASTSVGVALVTSDMVDLVLGPKWVNVKPFMPWLALALGVHGLTSSVYSAFDTIGRPRTSAAFQWTRVIALTVCVFPVAFLFHNVVDLAVTRLLVTLVVTPPLFFALSRALNVPVWSFAQALWRPIAAAGTMALCVVAVNAGINFTGPLRLALDVTTGAAVYGMTLVILWYAVGRPNGPERFAWQTLRPMLGLPAVASPAGANRSEGH